MEKIPTSTGDRRISAINSSKSVFPESLDWITLTLLDFQNHAPSANVQDAAVRWNDGKMYNLLNM